MLTPQEANLTETKPAQARGLLARIHLDLPLMSGIFLLFGCGLIILYSASGQDITIITKQVVRFGIGFVFMVALAQVPPETLRRWSPWFFVVITILLIVVLGMGEIGKGAKRWLDLGLLRFQPSEFMKLAAPMMIAWYLAEKSLPPKWRRVAVTVVLIFTPAQLIAAQPDLGTALLVASAGLFVLFLAGLSWRLIAGLVVVSIPAAVALWKWGMHEYQRERVLTFLDPERDPLGAGYHIIQSKIAIGSGGLYGKGWLSGTQSQLEFLPEPTTDFIFAVLAEEFGFSGSLLLIGIYLLILLRGLFIASRGQDTYSRLLAGALTLVIFVYLFVNVGMVSGLLPVVGVPLPLVSYGGTSMVTIMASFGILMSIHTHRKFLPA